MQEQKIIKTKVGLLELAKQLGNVSHACKIMVSARFYEAFGAASRRHRAATQTL